MTDVPKVLIAQHPGGTVTTAMTTGVQVHHLLFEEDGPVPTLPAGEAWERLARQLGILDELQPPLSTISCLALTNDGRHVYQVDVECDEAEEYAEVYYELVELYVRRTYFTDVALVLSVKDRFYNRLVRDVTLPVSTIRAGDWL